MADTSRDAPPLHTDFQELEDGEDLFPEPTAAQEVRRRWRREAEGSCGGQGVMPPADNR